MSNKIKIAGAGAGIVITLIFCYLFLLNADREIAVAPRQLSTPAASSPSATPDEKSISSQNPSPAKLPASTPEDNQMAIKDRIVKELQKNYGDTISKISTQASLYGVRNYILSMFPDNGEKIFSEIIKRAFPDFAEAIMATLKKLDIYNQWLADNEAILAMMSESEKTAALWEKREALFGDAAKEIWSGELLATDARKKTMQDTMAVLQESRDTTIEEKLDMFTTALHETYDNSPEEFILDYKDMSAKVFFSLDSVQDELKKLPPDQRQFEINKIRREMGFSQEEIEKMEEYDAVREKRWQVGLNYMAERDAVVAGSQGPEQTEKLKALREKYFQDEAGTIELEEKDNFFRFKRERVYGRN